MVSLAEIPTERDWIRQDGQRERVDILKELWSLETLKLSYRAPSDVVDQAIGIYQNDQRRSWIRTFNPFYWLGSLIDWLVAEAFNVVTIFGGNPQNARSSSVGRKIFSAAQFIGWLFCAGPGLN